MVLNIFLPRSELDITYKKLLSVNKQAWLLRLQPKTPTDATPLIGRIHPFRKIAMSFEPKIQLLNPKSFRMS